MQKKRSRIHIGLRTTKTVAAVVLSMLVVESYGATTSRLIFAMLGAMAAVQPTFTESVESCLTQIVGVLLGALAGVLLLALPIHPLAAAGSGMVLVITLYNALHIRFSASMPCLIVVTICTTPDIQPMAYAVGRIWDSAIGLGIGIGINTLIFPYDNSNQIRAIAESLDREVLVFLEDMFDGNNVLPDPEKMVRKIDAMARQLQVFSNQRLPLHLRRQRAELEVFRACEGKARDLLALMEVLYRMGRPGRLNAENRRRLKKCGARIRDHRPLVAPTDRDTITNYLVGQILRLRLELLAVLQE